MAGKNNEDLLKLEVNTTAAASTSCLESKLFVCKKDNSLSLFEAPPRKPSMSTVPKSHVLGKVQDFLGVISESNKKLLQDAKDLMLGVADLHTPEAVAAAESAMAGCPPLIHLAESEDTSDEDDDDDDKYDKISKPNYEAASQSAMCGFKDEGDSYTSKTMRKHKPKRQSKIVVLS